jgi:hypothetical protein
MLVKMTVDIQGFTTRSDGSTFEYPRRGREVELSREDAVDLINMGYAVPVPTQNVAETTRVKEGDDAEYRMVSAAKLFTRPETTPEPVTIPPEERAQPVVATEPLVHASEQITSPPAPPVPPEPEPIKRGPGRPRKYPRPGED